MKIKVVDFKKWTIKLFVSFGIWCLLSTVLLLSGKTQEYISIFAISSVVMVIYWIISYNTTKCILTIEEYINQNPKVQADYLHRLLSKQNYTDKQIGIVLDMLHKENEKQNYRNVSDKVNKIITDYKSYNVLQKIRFLADFPSDISLDKARALDEQLQIEEINNWIQKHDITEDEYVNIEQILNNMHSDFKSELVSSIIEEISNNLKLEYKTDDLNSVEYSILTTSDSGLERKLNEAQNIIFNNEKLFFVQNEVNFKMRYFCDLKEVARRYINGDFELKNNVKYEIPLNDIVCYATEGSKTVNSIISGGGVSGVMDPIKANIYRKSNVGLGGESGAIYSMLSDMKVEPIRTTLVEKDERVVILKTKKTDFIFRRQYAGNDLYLTFVNNMPDKDIERANIMKDAEKGTSNLDEIKKLKELLDIGAINQEEYDKKKAELLK